MSSPESPVPTPASPTGSAPAGPSQTIVLQPKESAFGRYGKFLIFVLIMAVLTIVGMAASYQSYFNPPTGPQEKFLTGSKTAEKKIAVIQISGTITESDTFVKQQLDRLRKDENVVAAVLRINSPGGTVTYSDYLYHHLRLLATGESRTGSMKGKPLPLVVSMGSVCASGGYFLACAVGDTPDSIFAEPATITGSIGVIIPHYDISGLLEKWSITDDSIASHPLKDMGSPTKPMTDQERALFQQLVDEMLDTFKAKVEAGRPLLRENPGKLDAVATGQIFSAEQAVENQLVDKIGFLEDALARAAELANVTVDSVRCVKFEKPKAPLEAFMGAAARQQPVQLQLENLSLDLTTLQELTSLRAYYLSRWTPVLPGNP